MTTWQVCRYWCHRIQLLLVPPVAQKVGIITTPCFQWRNILSTMTLTGLSERRWRSMWQNSLVCTFFSVLSTEPTSARPVLARRSLLPGCVRISRCSWNHFPGYSPGFAHRIKYIQISGKIAICLWIQLNEFWFSTDREDGNKPSVHPKNYAPVVDLLCWSTLTDFTHMLQDCFTGTGAIILIPQC